MKKYMQFLKKLTLAFVILTNLNILNCAQVPQAEQFIEQFKNANPYYVLGLNPNASTEQVQNAFDDLSARWSLSNWPGQEDLVMQVNYIIKTAYDKIMFKNYSKSLDLILNKAFNRGIIDNLKKLLIKYNLFTDDVIEILQNLENSKKNSDEFLQNFNILEVLITQLIEVNNLNNDAKDEILNQFHSVKSYFPKELTNQVLQINKPYAFNKIGSFKIDYRIQKMAWSSQGILAYQHENNYKIKFWDIKTHTTQDFFIQDWIRDFKWSPDGSMLAVLVKGNEKQEIQIWDYEKKSIVGRIEVTDINADSIENFAWSPDSNKIAILAKKELTYVLNIYDFKSTKIAVQYNLKAENGEDYESWDIEMLWIKENSLAILFDTSERLNIYDINLELKENKIHLKKQIPLISRYANIVANNEQLILLNYGISVFDTNNFNLIYESESDLGINDLSDLRASLIENIVAMKFSDSNFGGRNIIKIIDLFHNNVLKTFTAGAYASAWNQYAWSQDPNNLYFAFVNLTKIEKSRENQGVEPSIEIEIWQGTKLK